MTTQDPRIAALRELDYIEECCPSKKGTVLWSRFECVREALQAPQPEVTEWQPIETAPRDGDWFLVWNPNSNMCWGCYDMSAWTGDNGGYFMEQDTSEEAEFTHWMPLPKPPMGEG
jgi:hypothetical protein